MFFPERIVSILPSDKVLEVGPGSLPFLRADVYLDKYFTKEESFLQNGLAESSKLDKPLFMYSGDIFPFADNSFNYVVCSHVLEHVPKNELPVFVSELMRVAKRGYIEIPTLFYEFINFNEVHKWFINCRGNNILLLDKKKFTDNKIYDIYRSMFYCRDNYFFDSFLKYREFFFNGFEWNEEIHYSLVDDFSELIDDSDVEMWKTYFENKLPEKSEIVQPEGIFIKTIKRFYRGTRIILSRIFK